MKKLASVMKERFAPEGVLCSSVFWGGVSVCAFTMAAVGHSLNGDPLGGMAFSGAATLSAGIAGFGSYLDYKSHRNKTESDTNNTTETVVGDER